MKVNRTLPTSRRPVQLLMLALGSLLLAACSPAGGARPAGNQPATTAPATQPPATPAAPAAATVPAPPGASLDPCSLLTKQEVEAAVGASVADPKRESAGPLASCSFADADGFRVVSVTVYTGSNANDARQVYDFGKRNAGDPQAVASLGDDAYWGPLSNLQILKGRYELSLNVGTSPASGRLAIARSLASNSLTRLQ